MNYPLTNNDYNLLPFHLAARLTAESERRYRMAAACIMCPKCKHAPAVYKWSSTNGDDAQVECTNCHAKFTMD